MPLKLRLKLKPVPASRARVPRFGPAYFPKTYSKWRRDAEKLLPEYKGKPIDYPVQIIVVFAIPRAKTSKLSVPWGDGDNFEKAIYDLLTRKKYLEDDKWITTGTWRKRFIPHGQEGYCEVVLLREWEDIDNES